MMYVPSATFEKVRFIEPFAPQLEGLIPVAEVSIGVAGCGSTVIVAEAEEIHPSALSTVNV